MKKKRDQIIPTNDFYLAVQSLKTQDDDFKKFMEADEEDLPKLAAEMRRRKTLNG